MAKKNTSVEYKQVTAESDDVIGVIAEHAIEGWEPVSLYPSHIKGEGTMHLMVTHVKIVMKRIL